MYYLLISFILGLSYFTDCYAHVEFNYLTQLSDLNLAFTLSNYSKEERENNFNLYDKAYNLIKFLPKDIDSNPDHLLQYLHLSYKLANFFQQNDRPIDAEIVLKIASNALEKHFPEIHNYPALEACEKLRLLNPQLPSIYAALCHYNGKSYLKRPNLLPKEIISNSLEDSEMLVQRSLELRAIIDQDVNLYQDPSDSGKDFYSLHTLLFSRTLGYFYLKKGHFIPAKALYEKLFENSNLFEQVMASLQLIHINSQLAKQEWDIEKANFYYSEAYSKVRFLENYLSYKNWSGSSTALKILAEFYSNKDNPFYNLLKAKKLLETPFNNHHSISQDRIASISKNLGKIYEQLFQELTERSSQIDQELQLSYFTGKTSSLLNCASSDRVQGLIALAIIYREQKQFLPAALLLSNALSISDQLSTDLYKEIWYELYLIEKNYLATLPDDLKYLEQEFNYLFYLASMQRYKDSLQKAREQFEKNLTIENCWDLHEVLADNIQKIIESMFKETLFLLKPIHSPFAVIGIGSLSRNMMTPYSDLEYLIVHSESINSHEREQSLALSTLFLLRLIAIGETPIQQLKWNIPSNIDLKGLETREGLRPDSGGIIAHSFGESYKMNGNAQELIQASSTLALPMALMNGKLLFGSESIMQDFKKQVNERLSQSTQEERFSLLLHDLTTHTTPILHINAKKERYFSLKHGFLRGILTILNHLALNYEIFENHPQMILEELHTKKIISKKDQIQFDLFLRNIVSLLSRHYLKASKQSMEIIISSDEDLESFLHLTEQFYQYLKKLIPLLPFQTNIDLSLSLEKSRLRSLCYGGDLELVEKERAIHQLKYQNPQWEIQGDLEMLKGNFSLAYTHYTQALEENPTHTFLHFKLSESSIFTHEMNRASIHLDQVKALCQKSIHLAFKINYLECLMARKQHNWTRVSEILANIETDRKKFILQRDCLIYGLIEIEKFHLYFHLHKLDEAHQHLQIAKKIISNRYGALHPFSLPVYELLHLHLEPSKIQEKQHYQDHIIRIRELFPEIKWQGALNAHLLD